jgi:hypothetical protein
MLPRRNDVDRRLRSCRPRYPSMPNRLGRLRLGGTKTSLLCLPGIALGDRSPWLRFEVFLVPAGMRLSPPLKPSVLDRLVS